MALESYHQKRDFKKTTEPKGSPGKKAGGRSFVIQKHAARRLHYDFRIEVDGVLRSWAVTRGPSLVPGEKRLAVHVEDHPLEYGDFEGTIPKGEYGGGAVIVWDRGTWSPVGDADRGYKKGHLEFALEGEKLGGRWHLVRMAGKPREKRENWLLIKSDDEFARGNDEPDILQERPESVKSGRDVADLEGEAPGWSSKTGRIDKTPAANTAPRKRVAREKSTARKPSAAAASVRGSRKASMPGFIEPQLATLRAEAPSGDRWIHEIKFDGYRLQAHISEGKARLLTRSGLDWTDRFGTAVAKALASLPMEAAIIDGELTVEGGNGASDFSALQADLSEGRSDRFVFYAFDLMHLDGRDLTGAALVDRKAELARLLAGSPSALRYSEHFDEDGEMILRHACRLSLEGVISKLRDGPYRPGRGRDWIKSKCAERQELVIAGYTPSSTSDKAIGSLVLGHYVGDDLVHAGRVGTGFSRKVAEDLYARLEPLAREKSPFATTLSAEARRNVRFVEPGLVAEVEFRSWTGDGVLRHASFRGLREDKAAKTITREDGGSKKGSGALPRWTVKLTHPDRIYWKDAGVTKQGLAEYYSEAWRFIAPHVVHRPLALLRCPGGVGGQCFFQKHAWKGMNGKILTLHDQKDKSGEPIVGIDGFDGLIGLVQGGVLEIHPWQAPFDDLEKPDQIVMDLDPGEGVTWDEIVAAAREVRERMEAEGLACFLKTSGGKGLHVVSPLEPRAGWEAVKGFAKRIADEMSADSPDRFVATVSKAKRKGKILIDYLRNGRGATAVAPYSTRARDGAPVSMPIGWEELGPDIGPATFTVTNAAARLANLSADPWENFRKAAAPIGGPEKPTRRTARKVRKPA
ncbi:DNA ligase D [Aquibium carbonis]|uniref:DNA ligase (ATP) n=1 Tax=Aquibium carbonis TaxID=2495581 RepID=A0A3S0AUL0_9HYPH|nr:DNA ligase D [Aquibium carbonis]RST87481.1 DNA ligase D [Aquibium carbonis]